eukprot:TRINITY_DN21032_c0_g1_i1.p1 TRINITY_DN21032_c0_g1~~TRINITY_DN21032_c0_g1_i1.p1  ORF type:complete len:823 (-),score=163.62 TRINITY_DN21032_c0_g1_i1:94-2562(-)
MTTEKKDDQDLETVELGEYLSFIKAELDAEEACLELPFTLMLLVSFAMLALMHLKQDRVYTVESSLKFDIEENANFAWSHNFGHKVVQDVNSIADLWSWFRLGFMPLVVQHTWGFSEDLQFAYDSLNTSHPFSTGDLPGQYGVLPVRDDWLHYNRFVGGFRVQQERVPDFGYDKCRIPGVIPEATWKEWLGKPCMPADPAYELKIENWEAEVYNNISRVEWFFPLLESLDDSRMHLTDMEDGCAQLAEKGGRACSCSTCPPKQPWIDEHTQRVEIGFVVFNADYGLISLVTVNFFFNRAGSILKFVHVQSSWSDHFDGSFFQVTGMLLCDAIYMFAIARVFITELNEIIKTIRVSKEKFYKSFYDDYLQFWNMVDWISIFCAVLVITMWVQLYVRTQDANGALADLVAYDASTGDRALYQELSISLFAAVETMCEVERTYRFSFCLYPMVVMLRLFKSFDAQARLAVVTRTLYLAAPGLVHFFIVFASVYFCMAVNGVLLFGQVTDSFATLFRSTCTCFRAMFGDWDWDAMKEVGREWAMIWFWLFCLIISVILLNMLLAILMDSYAAVSAEVTDAQTLPQQVSEIIRRHRQSKRKERVKLNDVFAAYFAIIKDEKDMLESKELITANDLIREVEGMKMNQATRTIRNALNAVDRRNATPFTQDDVKKSMSLVLNRLRLVRDHCEMMRRTFQGFDEHAVSLADVTKASRSMEQRQALASSVEEVVGQLSARVSDTIGGEMQLFEERKTTIRQQQADMLRCVKDSHRLVRELRDQTLGAMENVRATVDARQQASYESNAPPVSQGFPFASCADVRRREPEQTA